MQNRRKFIQQTLMAGAAFTTPAILHAREQARPSKLTILHTNDTHSRIDPFPVDGGRYSGLGGVVARETLIREIRAQEEQVLLLDAGDIFQGTPYFNLYKGEPEIRCMTAMGYDAATIGNHDFDGGMENLATQLKLAGFPLLVCNYDFTGTPLEYSYEPYRIYKKGPLKIGVLGVSIELKGLVPENLYGSTVYLDPVKHANETANRLKHKDGCDMVICLSHLGYKYEGPKLSDEVLAKESEDIDLIIGGHTHTFMESPAIYHNKTGSEVVVNQVGWAGVKLGRLDYEFSKLSGKKLMKSDSLSVIKKTLQ